MCTGCWLAGAALVFSGYATAQKRQPLDFAVPEILLPTVPDSDPQTPRGGTDPWNVVRPPDPAPRKKDSPAAVLSDWDRCNKPGPDDEETVRSCGFVIEDTSEPSEKRARALASRGAIYQRQTLTILAIADLTEAIRLSPKLAVAYQRRGSIWLRERDFENALKDLNTAVSLLPKSAELRVARGIAHRGLRNFDPALRDFDEALKLSPRFPVAFYERALTSLEQKEFDAALSDLQKALEIDPNFALGYYGIGNVRRATGDFDQAIAAYDKALELNPNAAAIVYLARGVARQMDGNCKEALKDFATALRAAPRAPQILKARGRCWRGINEPAFAVDELTQAILLYPRDPEAYYERGMALLQQAEYGKAGADFDEAIKLKKDYAVAYIGRAIVKRNRKELKEAIADINKSIEVEPSAMAFAERGWTHVLGMNTRHALLDFEHALTLDEDNALAMLGRGYLRRLNGAIAQGELDMVEAIRRDPNVLQRLTALGIKLDQ